MARPRKAEHELKHPRSKNGKDKGVIAEVTKGELRNVTIPHGDKGWHPIAKRLYDSFRRSGQVDFWQDSDWNYAWFIISELSDYLSKGRKSSMQFGELNRALERLLVTEADRRKARIELQSPVEEEASAAELAVITYMGDLKKTASAA